MGHMPGCAHAVEQRGCDDCRDRAYAKPPPDPELPGRWEESAISTYCTGCGQKIEPGDMMRASGNRGWLGMCCGQVTRTWRGPVGYDTTLVRLHAAGRLDTGRGTG